MKHASPLCLSWVTQREAVNFFNCLSTISSTTGSWHIGKHFDSSDWCYAVHCLSERMKKSGGRKQHRRWPYGLRAYPKLAKPKPNTGHADEMAIKLTAANLEAGPNTRATRMVLQLRGAESNQAEKPERERHPVRPPHGRGCLARRCNPIRFFHSCPAAQALVGHAVSKLRSHT